MNAAIEKLKASPLEHLGERVITLGMMDEAHGRPEGAARKAFNRNKDKLAEGRHYFRGAEGSSVLRTTSGRGDDVLLTERGYLMLVKTFRDDLAWQVQEELVEGYFRALAQAAVDPAMELARQALNAIVGFIQPALAAQARETERRFADLERQVKQLRAGARVQATGRRGGTERKTRHRSAKSLPSTTPLLPLPGGHA